MTNSTLTRIASSARVSPFPNMLVMGDDWRSEACDIDGCVRSKTRKVYGWCETHYGRWRHKGDVNWQPPTPQERFERFVDRSGECHRFTGSHDENGYGHFGIEPRTPIKAHRAALLLAGITIPPGLTIDHVWARGCRYKDCVRLDHLEIVTNAVNGLRGNSPPAVNARKTHCIRGHEFTPENTGRQSRRGGRRCKTCVRMQGIAARERKRAERGRSRAA